jgi:hypothetical protein
MAFWPRSAESGNPSSSLSEANSKTKEMEASGLVPEMKATKFQTQKFLAQKPLLS